MTDLTKSTLLVAGMIAFTALTLVTMLVREYHLTLIFLGLACFVTGYSMGWGSDD